MVADPWPGAQIEPESERRIVLQTTFLPSMPAWADVPLHIARVTGTVPDGTYLEPRSIAVGVPGADKGDLAPGIRTFQDCIELRANARGGRLSFLTWHTNVGVCRWEGEVASIDASSVVAIEDRTVAYFTSSGQRGLVSGCRVRATFSGAGLVLDEDWPPGCTMAVCGARGTAIGRAATRKSAEPCEALARVAGAEFLLARIGPKPPWASEVAGARARTLADYGGVWTAPHSMRITSLGAKGRMRVVDRLAVCAGTEPSPRYALQNWTVNGHSCWLAGRATENAAGDLLLVSLEGAPLYFEKFRQILTGPACHLRAARADGRLEIVDEWPADCYREGCGARAAPIGVSFHEGARNRAPCVAALEDP